MIPAQAKRRPAPCLSDFVLDQWLASELAGAARERAREHLRTCARCSQRLSEFERTEVPPLSPEVLSSSAPEAPAAVIKKPRAPALGSRWLLLAAALFGTVLGLQAFLPSSEESSALALHQTRTKGALGLAVIARRASGEVVRLAPGDVVFPGDGLRFELISAERGYAVVLALDARGVVSRYAPASGVPGEFEAGRPVLLPEAIAADDTIGPERILAFNCAAAPDVAALERAAAQALQLAQADPRRVEALGTPCAEASFMIEKKTSEGTR